MSPWAVKIIAPLIAHGWLDDRFFISHPGVRQAAIADFLEAGVIAWALIGLGRLTG